jgi:hypothetical protein
MISSHSAGWPLAVASGAAAIGGFLLARHFASTPWPLAGGKPAVLVAAGLLLLVAQALKAIGWGRLFAPCERPLALALAAGNGGGALIRTILPGRFDDAMRVAVVRRASHAPAHRCESSGMRGHPREEALATPIGVLR